jgi:hypothetical protein
VSDLPSEVFCERRSKVLNLRGLSPQCPGVRGIVYGVRGMGCGVWVVFFLFIRVVLSIDRNCNSTLCLPSPPLHTSKPISRVHRTQTHCMCCMCVLEEFQTVISGFYFRKRLVRKTIFNIFFYLMLYYEYLI